MFCPKCGTSLNGDEDFCSNCGANMKEIREQNNNISTENNINSQNDVGKQAQSTMTEMFSKKSKNFLSPILAKIKEFISNYKKQILIVLAVIIAILVGIFLYGNFVGFEKLSWDESYLDTKTKYVTQTKLKLGVKFSNKEKADEIKWTTTCGEVKGKGLEITWDLSNITGQCEITASYKLKNIKRSINVIPFDFKEEDLSLKYKIDENSDEDLDYDGLTNKQEKENIYNNQ